ncbi:MAG: lipoate--protein ligase [Bacteroidaceae bacterium]|nr:lipoate--protein ligase [Bacteroidaceae bacterium]
MIHVSLPNDRQHKLPFYLAMEEYVARMLPTGDYFFMWQVEPTVIFGRNQLIDSEVDIEYCKQHGIAMYRRKSGGGCVYADKSNIMFSYITADTNVNFTFNKYMLMVEHVLQKLGIDAKTTGRNDIVIDGKKVSGNAFYHLSDRSIVHGTMLFDTDLEKMARSTTPSDAKLKSKGVESVRQRVTTLNKYITISIDEFKQFVVENLCDSELLLDDDALNYIAKIEQEYYSDEFVFGNNPAYSLHRKVRIEGVGEFDIRIEVKNSVIKKINLLGDFFLVGDLDNMLLARLKGVEFTSQAMQKALSDIDSGKIIMNMKKEHITELIKNIF